MVESVLSMGVDSLDPKSRAAIDNVESTLLFDTGWRRCIGYIFAKEPLIIELCCGK